MSQNSNNNSKDDSHSAGSSARGPKQIESDLEHNRSRMDDMLDQLQAKFSPDELIDQAKRYARRRSSDGSSSNLQEMVVRNPLPVTLIGVGMAWLLLAGRNGSVPHEDSARDGTDSRSARGNGDASGASDDWAASTRSRDPVAESPPASAPPGAPGNEASGTAGREQSTPADTAGAERAPQRSDAGRHDPSKRSTIGAHDRSQPSGAGYSDPARGSDPGTGSEPASGSDTGGTSQRGPAVAATTRTPKPAPR